MNQVQETTYSVKEVAAFLRDNLSIRAGNYFQNSFQLSDRAPESRVKEILNIWGPNISDNLFRKMQTVCVGHMPITSTGETANNALGNCIIIGHYYGYSRTQNGHTWVVIGRARSFKNGKVTLDHIKENNYMYIGEGKQKPHNTIHPERARTVASVTLFPVDITTLKSK